MIETVSHSFADSMAHVSPSSEALPVSLLKLFKILDPKLRRCTCESETLIIAISVRTGPYRSRFRLVAGPAYEL